MPLFEDIFITEQPIQDVAERLVQNSINAFQPAVKEELPTKDQKLEEKNTDESKNIISLLQDYNIAVDGAGDVLRRNVSNFEYVITQTSGLADWIKKVKFALDKLQGMKIDLSGVSRKILNDINTELEKIKETTYRFDGQAARDFVTEYRMNQQARGAAVNPRQLQTLDRVQTEIDMIKNYIKSYEKVADNIQIQMNEQTSLSGSGFSQAYLRSDKKRFY